MAPRLTVRPGRRVYGLGTADDGHDQDDAYASVVQRHPEAAVVVPPRSMAVPSDIAETAPTQHDRIGWPKRSGYTRQALVEVAIAR